MGIFDFDVNLVEPEWLEQPSFFGLRIWHLGFFCFSGLVCIGQLHWSTALKSFNHKLVFSFAPAVVMLCCCFRFRIPRTKQEIEADFQVKLLNYSLKTKIILLTNYNIDYQRRVIAKNFRERLANIKNSEMDDMNLQKGEPNHAEI